MKRRRSYPPDYDWRKVTAFIVVCVVIGLIARFT